eukprot:UN07931
MVCVRGLCKQRIKIFWYVIRLVVKRKGKRDSVCLYLMKSSRKYKFFGKYF